MFMAATRPTPAAWLVIGSPIDPLVERVVADLASRGCRTLVVENPLAAPARLSWSLDTTSSVWTLETASGDTVGPSNLGGVFVRRAPLIERADWAAGDAEYVQSETNAALLAWLWALDGPVVGRMPADLWYRPRPGLVAWLPRLQAVGLRGIETLLTNADRRRPRFPNSRAEGIVHRPLSITTTWRATSPGEWRRLAAVQQEYPMLLEPSRSAQAVVDVIGGEIIWQSRATPVPALEQPLVALARSASVDVLEVDIDAATDPPTVTAVDPTILPRDGSALDTLAAAVGRALTGAGPRAALP
jgi:hypothetical protein